MWVYIIAGIVLAVLYIGFSAFAVWFWRNT